MTAQNSPIRRTLSITEGETESCGGDQLESGGPTARPVIQAADNGMIASNVEVEQHVTLPPTTTGFPYNSNFAKDGQNAYGRKQCSPWCSCACHTRTIFTVPSPFGTLSGSFSGLPLLKPRCAENACKSPEGPSGNIFYQFPTWFWSRLIAVTMTSSPVCGPEINVRFPRVVMPSKLYLFALHGDARGVKRLFTEGTASPWDVNPRGSSALYVSHTYFTLASFLDHLWFLFLLLRRTQR